MNATHADWTETPAGSTNGFLRESALRRYHLVIKSAIEPAGGKTPPSPKRASRRRWLKFKGEWLIAPFFLFSSLAIILLAPEKLVKKITAPFTKADFWDQVGKRTLDFVGAIAGFIFSAIFFIVVPVLIKMDSKGPVFYGQQRAGLNYRKRDRRQVNIVVAHDRRVAERRQQDLFGRPFTVYKFRTMQVDAEKNSGAVWAQKNDPRVTRMGRILRFIHMDEIPQFFNVLCGEMSLVGPRPERPQIMARLIEDIPQFPERLQVKPGITGIAQIYCGYDASIEDAREKLQYDLLYVKNSTFKYDVKIMLKTLWMIIHGREVVKS
ncbi:MAG: sugar transferase [candidate division KSB1 bacterium]|nr:sugar transferase [candidate division KSB1 bacterium]MDZ7368168.1 sugar transferase [candidate division KSB1 bacterium]MDZ7405941.1 sugar transferase [candidate division KSB1 bacterium]